MGVILDSLPVREAVQTMVDLANLRGGPDNITVIAVKVKSPKMATAADLPSDEELGGGGVHPALWAAIGFCVLGAVVLLLLKQGLMSALFLVGGVVAGGIAVLQKMNAGPRRGVGFMGGPFGKGPYRSYPCQATAEQAGKFAETVNKLRTAASKDGWLIDWAGFDGHATAAAAAAERQDYAEAVAQHSHAIRFMLQQLRTVKGKANAAGS
jgi:protein phosphatase